MRHILFVWIILLTVASTVGATDWYVKPSCSTNGDGTGPNCASANGQPGAWGRMDWIVWGDGGVQAGDTLYICSDTERRTYVGASGTADNPITIKPLPGANPILRTFYRYPNPWQDLGDGRFKNNYYTGYFWQDDVIQVKATSPDLTDGVWYFQYEDGTPAVYYRPPAGTRPEDHDIKVSWVRAPFYLQGNDYLVFDGLHFAQCTMSIFSDSNNAPKHIEIKNCTFELCASAAISLRGYGGDEIEDIKIHDCRFRMTAEDIFLGSHGGGTERVNDVWLYNNLHWNTYGTNNGQYTWGDCGSLADGESYGIQNGNGIHIYNNQVYRTHDAVILWANSSSSFSNVTVRDNLFFNCDDHGIYLSSSAQVFSNIDIVYNVFTGYGAGDNKGIGFTEVNSASVRAVNNTVIGFGRNIFLGHEIDNIIIQNNLSFNPNGQHVSFAYADTGAIGVAVNYNLYWPDGSDKFESNYHQYHNFDGWKTTVNKDANSKLADPLLSDWRLTYASPAQNAGIAISDIHGQFLWPDWGHDIDGDSIVNAPDIGADEYRVHPHIGGSLVKIKRRRGL